MTSAYVDGVLDLTFHDITDENSLNIQITNKIMALTNQLPQSPTNKTQTGGGPGSPGNTFDGAMTTSPKSRFRKQHVKAVRLGNNEIISTRILVTLPAHIDTSRIQWLDLSFNFIEDILDDIAKLFPQLTTIYLHANRISKLSEVKKLGQVENLRSLSLYGNPVEENKHYRNYVIYMCKNLHTFDKSPVTKSQLDKVRNTFKHILKRY
jgi:Leucine-rich repeat (LRR) protein